MHPSLPHSPDPPPAFCTLLFTSQQPVAHLRHFSDSARTTGKQPASRAHQLAPRPQPALCSSQSFSSLAEQITSPPSKSNPLNSLAALELHPLSASAANSGSSAASRSSAPSPSHTRPTPRIVLAEQTLVSSLGCDLASHTVLPRSRLLPAPHQRHTQELRLGHRLALRYSPWINRRPRPELRLYSACCTPHFTYSASLGCTPPLRSGPLEPAPHRIPHSSQPPPISRALQPSGSSTSDFLPKLPWLDPSCSRFPALSALAQPHRSAATSSTEGPRT